MHCQTHVASRAAAPSSLTRRRLLASAGAFALATRSQFTTASEAEPRLYGVNLAGAEFGDSRMPGRMWRDYFYPSNARIDYFATRNFNCIRVPFRWERVQDGLSGPLRSAEIAELDRIVEHASDRGVVTILDCHNYARYTIDSAKQLIDGPNGLVGRERFVDLWSRLAMRYKDRPNVVFGLMNEPFGLNLTNWVRACNEAIAAIRKAGSSALIAVPGTAYSGAHSWATSGNASAMLDIVDPLGRLAFETHQYLDANSSGFYASADPNVCAVGSGSARLRPFTEWCLKNARRGLLAEFGAPSRSACPSELRALLDHVRDNPDAYLGWVAWASGPFEQTYALTLDPPANAPHLENSTVSLLRHYIPGATIELSAVPIGLSAAAVGEPLKSARVAANGGMPSYAFQVVEGALPEGVHLNRVLGEIGGTPLRSGHYTFSIEVTDDLGRRSRTPKISMNVSDSSGLVGRP